MKLRHCAFFAITLAASVAACNKANTTTGAAASASASASAMADPDSIPAPPDVKAPPADAQKLPSGLASKVLQAGTGTKRPESWDKVKLHYTGWTTDGKMFDSSKKRRGSSALEMPEPIDMELTRVIPGFAEGVRQMVEGEKRRIWIPEELAYKGGPNGPKGMLVFDLEVISIAARKPPPPTPSNLQEPPKEAKKHADGIYSLVVQKGTGTTKPKGDDTVKVHLTQWDPEGRMGGSTVMDDKPLSTPLKGAEVPGLEKTVSEMVEGEKRHVWVPFELLMKGMPGAPKGYMVFEFELLGISKPIKAPADVKAPPKDAEKTASGLASKVIKKGTGDKKPGAQGVVQVHYTGWTTDGKMFDSSEMRGEPAAFGLNQVIPGWGEGVQLMVEGERRRFWIPEELAYKGQPGAPAGMLVFEVELLKIIKP